MIKIGDIFDYQGKQPNFKRDFFSTLSELKNYPSTSVEEGHISFCQETNTRYRFSDSFSDDPTTGKWRRVIDTALDESSENSVQNKVIVKSLGNAKTELTSIITALSDKLVASDNNIIDEIETNEKIESEAIGDLKKDMDALAEIAGESINNIKTSAVSITTTINGHDLSQDVVLTKADIGLGSVDNTSDLGKPISTATQGALDGKVDKKTGYSLVADGSITKLEQLPTAANINASLTNITNQIASHAERTDNPHQVTAAQLGLGSYTDYSVSKLPVSEPQQAALDLKVDKTTTVNGLPLSSNITLVKSDVGLANVDNTSDINKPISTATQTAITSEANTRSNADTTLTTNLNAEITRAKAAETTNATEVSNLNTNTGVTSYETFSASKSYTAGSVVIYGGLLKIFTVAHAAGSWISTDNTSYSINTRIANEETRAKAAESSNSTSITNEVTRAKAAETTNETAITNEATTRSSADTTLQSNIDKKVDKTITVNGYALSNNVTLGKSDVGLANVDNTSDINKPISTATQTAITNEATTRSSADTTLQSNIDKKVDKTITVNGHALDSNVTVTKGDVGLGNCDNTSDINKPISTATQTALDLKTDITDTVNDEKNLSASIGDLKDRVDKNEELTSNLLNELTQKSLKFWTGSATDYSAITTKDESTLYIII